MKRFNLISMIKSESVSAYGARLKCAAHEIELGDERVKIGELELIGRFLDGVQKEYDDLTTGLIQGIEEISFDQFSEIIQTKSAFINRREEESKLYNNSSGTTSFYSKRTGPLRCYKCNKPGHIASYCPDLINKGNIDIDQEVENSNTIQKQKPMKNVNFAVSEHSSLF
jgi:hypothetical protein